MDVLALAMGLHSDKERILVVDDDPSVLAVLESKLSVAFDVLTTASAVAALELAAADPELAVVLSDQVMPDMRGDVLLGKLRERSSASRVLITGHGDLEVLLRAVNEGQIFAFVAKPWTTEDLLFKVRQAAHHFRLRRELELEVAERTKTELALRSSEERLLLALKAANVGLFDWNLQSGEFLYSAALTKAGDELPLSTRSNVKALEERVHPEDLPRVQAAVQVHLEHRQPFQTTAIRSLSPDGSAYRWYEMNAQAAWDEQGKPRCLVGSILDVDDLRRAREQLLQAHKLQGIGQLAGGVAHEINTPIQYITDNASFALRAFGKLKSVLEAYEAVARAARAEGAASGALAALDGELKTHRLDYLLKQTPLALQQGLAGLSQVGAVVKAMKEFAHPSEGLLLPGDLHDVIESACAVSRNEWRYAAEMAHDFDRSLPPIPMVRDELAQVFLNLIINAAQAIHAATTADTAPPGKISIRTRLTGEFAEVRVGDTGRGIPDDIQPRVFEPFFTTREVGKGLGQGLAVAHSVVVEKHRGSIDFETETGKGTVFVVRLPTALRATAEATPA